MSFPSTHASLALALAQRDYNEPTPVQLAVLQANAADKDLLVSAQTGSGKTVAYGLAMASTLLGEAERFEHGDKPLALIIAPTRELALQVHKELSWLYGKTGARLVTCVGGMDPKREQKALQAGCQFVIGTPGRLRDHLERGRLDISGLRVVVLDEADEMLDLGFREDLEFILQATPDERRTLLFSATIPKNIASLARQYQRDAVRIDTIARNQPHGDIEYRAYPVAPFEIERAAVNLLRFFDSGSALVFCSTREGVKRLHAALSGRGFACVALSGELSQSERTSALQSLRDGRARVCVATDVAARGLDLPDLGLVIHADLPNDPETLLHRSGRTGRAGRKGVCALLVPHAKRRRAEIMIDAAGVDAAWTNPPTAEAIRALDQERLLVDPMFTADANVIEQGIAGALLAKHAPEQIAIALARLHASRLPMPQEMTDLGPAKVTRVRDGARDKGYRGETPKGEAFKRETNGREGYQAREGRGYDAKPREPRLFPDPAAARTRRPDAQDMVWFKVALGHQNKADPKWLVPLICRAGGVTKSEIGAIRIFDTETKFEIVKEHAEKFAGAKGRADDGEVMIEATTPAGPGPKSYKGGKDAKPDSKGDEQRPFAPKKLGEKTGDEIAGSPKNSSDKASAGSAKVDRIKPDRSKPTTGASEAATPVASDQPVAGLRPTIKLKEKKRWSSGKKADHKKRRSA